MKFLLKKRKYELALLLTFAIFYLPYLGQVYVQPTGRIWVKRGIHFYEMFRHMRFSDTYTKYHPGVTLMWINGVSYKIFYRMQKILYGVERDLFVYEVDIYRDYALIAKFFIILVIFLTLIFVFRSLKKGLGIRFAFLTIFFFISEPFVIANMRSIHVDGLVTIFMFASVISFYMFLNYERSGKYLLLTALFTGLALLTKISALVLFPFFIASLFLNNIYSKGKEKLNPFSMFKIMSALVLISATIFILLFPAMWSSPVETVKKIVYDGFIDTALGDVSSKIVTLRWFTENSFLYAYFSYFLHIVFRSTPFLLFFTVMSAFPLFNALTGKRKIGKAEKLLFMALLFFVGYYLMISLAEKKIFRYTLPLYPFLSIVASYGALWLCEIAKPNKRLSALVLALMLLQPLSSFPNFFTYFNLGLGGIKNASKVISLNQDGTGYYMVARYLNSKDNAEDLYVAMYDSGPMHVFFKGHSVKLKLYNMREGREVDTDYVLLPRQIGWEYLPGDKYELEGTFRFSNFDYWYLYRKII